MNEPGISLLDGNTLNVRTNDQNLEEEEDIKEQIKRREELQNLLTNVLEDYKYEDSTINSSTNVSMVSADYVDRTYRDAQTPYEQIKLLYDIRMKEIQAMKDEFEEFKMNSAEEINALKRKLTLQEAETSQLEMSLRNTKSLLVEKVYCIAEQDKRISAKDDEIASLKKGIEQLQYDVEAYNSTIAELQLKLTMDTGPYNVAARVFNAEERQSRHKEQIERLEALLNEERRKTENLERERIQLEDSLKSNIENNNENELLHNNTVALLNANVESAQNQCKELLNLVEMLSKENEYFRVRVQKLEASEPILLSNSFKRKSLDYDTLLNHNERLKKMLLDKDVQLSTLKSKVKFYDNDVKELLEFRNIKNRSLLNKECNQPEHYEKICQIQNEMKYLQQEIMKKNEEISNLSSINQELENKIENMIMQTRNDLENLSNKYKLPELETMNEELQNAQIKIKELQEKLASSEAEAEELRSKIDKNDINELKLQLDEEEKKVLALEEILKSKQIMDEQGNHLIEENDKLRKEIEKLSIKIRESENQHTYKDEFNLLKKEYNQLTEQLKELNISGNEENASKDILILKADIEDCSNIYKIQQIGRDVMEIKFASWVNQLSLNSILVRKLVESGKILKKNYDELYTNLKESEKQIEKLTEIIEEVNNSKIMLEGEKSNLEIELGKLKDTIDSKNREIDDLNDEIESLRNEEQNSTIKTLEDASQHLEEAKAELIRYQEELRVKSEIIKNCEDQIQKLEIELQNTRGNFESSQDEITKLRETLSEFLGSEIKKQIKQEDKQDEDDIFKARVLKAEVSIQEDLRKEYERRVCKIEQTYRNIFEVNQKKLDQFKEQENNYRHQLADLLSKYAQIISPIQKENEEMKEHLKKMEDKYLEMKKYVETSKKEYSVSIEKTRKDAQKAIDSWKIWAKRFVQGCLSIEKLNAQSRNAILNSLKEFDAQVESVDKYFEEKVRQYKKKYNLSKT